MKRAMILIAAMLIAVVAGYVSLSPGWGIAQGTWSAMLFHPEQHCRDYSSVKDIYGIKPENIFFPSKNGNMLHGWFFDARKGTTPGGKTIVLVSHGNSGNVVIRSSVTRAALKSGASVFLYDYQGFGKSQGHPTLQGIVEDGLSAFDYITKNLGYQNKDIVLYGESLGTGVSCEVANQRKCAGVILQSGFMGLPEIAREKIALLCAYPDAMFPMPQLHNAELVKHISCPVLVLHGKQDWLIPVRHAEIVYANAAHKFGLIEIDGAGHADLYKVNPSKMYAAIATFLGSISRAM
jgi:fermentation-respiration switch protein FrsA (DUF1100 family)